MPQNSVTPIYAPIREIDCKFNTRCKDFGSFKKYSCFSKEVFNPYKCEVHNYNPKLEKRTYCTDSQSRDDNIKRAKDKAFEIAYANDFKYFITFTLDKDKIDRYDTSEIIKRLNVWLSNKVRRNNLMYLIFPEYHSLKEGEDKPAIHFHGLVSGDLKLIDSGHVTKNGQVIYNCESWGFGFSTVIELTEDYERIVNYVMKYITKEKKKIFGKFYFSGGKGLNRSVPTHYSNIYYPDFPGEEYYIENARMSVKYVTDYNF